MFGFFDYSAEGSTTFQRVVKAVESGSLEFDASGVAYFDTLRTAPESRGSGIATQLMLRVLDFLADHQVATHGFLTAAPPDVEDRAASPRGRLPRFYQKLGWRRIGRSESMFYDFESMPARTLDDVGL